MVAREVIVLPEMIAAGMKAMDEAHHRDLSAEDVVIGVYLAMRAIEAMVVMQEEGHA